MPQARHAHGSCMRVTSHVQTEHECVYATAMCNLLHYHEALQKCPPGGAGCAAPEEAGSSRYRVALRALPMAITDRSGVGTVAFHTPTMDGTRRRSRPPTPNTEAQSRHALSGRTEKAQIVQRLRSTSANEAPVGARAPTLRRSCWPTPADSGACVADRSRSAITTGFSIVYGAHGANPRRNENPAHAPERGTNVRLHRQQCAPQ